MPSLSPDATTAAGMINFRDFPNFRPSAHWRGEAVERHCGILSVAAARRKQRQYGVESGSRGGAHTTRVNRSYQTR